MAGEIELVAGEAFGSGEHPTTQGAIGLLHNLAGVISPSHVLDVGCGSGILMLAAKQFWPDVLLVGCDCEAEAIAFSRYNLAQAGHEAKLLQCDATKGGLLQPDIAAQAPYPLIMANIIAEPLIAMADDVAALLAVDGVAIISGVLMWREGELLAAYGLQGLELVQKLAIGQWRSYLFMRPA